MSEIVEYKGNYELLKLKKTVFLCSRRIPASVVLKSYDWAAEQREKGNCIISGFHSRIEKDVLHYLLKGKQPIIAVLARGMKEKINSEFKAPLEQGRMLLLSPFERNVKRITKETSAHRNKFMVEIADKVVIGYAEKSGGLWNLLVTFKKEVKYL